MKPKITPVRRLAFRELLERIVKREQDKRKIRRKAKTKATETKA